VDDRSPWHDGRVSPSPPFLARRVLVVRLGAIGDVVNALVFAAALQELEPAVHIGWAVHPLAEPLVRGHPCVARVHVWRRGGGLAELRRLVREVRRERYELAVDLQRIQKSALLAWLSGAPRVLGFDRARTKEASWIWTNERIPAGDPDSHRVEQYLEVARHLGWQGSGPHHLLPRDAAAEAWAEERVRELGAAPIVLAVGASKPANRWPPERFGELARALASELAAPVVLTGGPDDRAAAERAVAAAAGALVDLVGRTDLRQLAALVARARLFVGCDTGPMHVAAALERPVVALFGPADPRRTGPWGRGHAIVRGASGETRHARMEDITV
jgi:lipopolysaccharide heptosyltransferase I